MKEKKVFILENLGCAHCASKMEEKINQIKKVEKATVSFATKKLYVEGSNIDSLVSQIQEICQNIESNVKVIPETKVEKHEKENHRKELLGIIFGAALFIGVEIYHEIGGVEEFSWPLILLFVVAYFVLGGGILLEAGKNILKGQIFDENFLMSIATLGAFAIGEYPEAVGVMLFFRIGEYFEHVAVEKSRSQIMDAVDLRPETIQRIEADQVTEVPAEEGKIGDLLLVRPGDRIPLDGVVVEGESRIDTSAITGEPVPKRVREGMSILSGGVNTSGVLKIRVEKPLGESMVSRILDSVENAAANKPKIDNFITRFARVYTPIVVVVALFTALGIPFLTGQAYYPWIYTALTFLVMSCPCALVLSVPLAFFCGIGAGSKKGILFKGGVVMEALSDVKTVIMDKTGTITKGNFVVQHIKALEIEEQELLRLCASVETSSTHPIATSIVEEALGRGLELYKTQQVKEISGKGIVALVQGQEVLCGNKALLELHKVSVSLAHEDELETTVYVAVDGIFKGTIGVADTIKEDAKSSIAALNAKGIHTVMLTGDAQESAQRVAKETGVNQVFAKLLPEEKLNQLLAIRKERGKVAFVGDGINDAPVLAGADVGAAMGSGADAAIEAADVVFMNSNMEAISQAISIAKKTTKIAKQNVIFALTLKIIVMILGITGIYSNMWLAVFADTGVAFLCILNSIRILRK